MKSIYLIAIVFLLQSTLSAQSKVVLGEEEIRKSPYTKFENRSDKFATPELRAIEADIGKGLHDLVIQTDKPINYKGFTLQRFYSDEKGKFGGDILALNKNASYGHINSIKRILNAYIQHSFEYTEKNADVLVMEVLYYNAQNRNKLDRIKKRYTKSLVAALTKNKVGIGKKFSEWPGNTQIVIPIKYSEDPKKLPEVTEDKPQEEKKEESSTGKPPVVEKEKIKQAKSKIPSSEIPKENITNIKKKPDDKKNKTDETVIKEEKKIIEKKTDSPEKAKDSVTETKTTNKIDKQDNSKIVENKKHPEETKSEKEPIKEAKTDNPVKEIVKEEVKKESKTVVINEPKKAVNDDKPKEDTAKTVIPTKEIKKEDQTKKAEEKTPDNINTPKNTKDDSKKVETTEKKPQDAKVVESAKKTPEETKSVKEPSKETKTTTPTKEVVKEEVKKESKTVVVNEPKKADNDNRPKEDTAKTVIPAKETVKEEPKKESKTVAINEPKKAVNDDKPVAKEIKTETPAKKVEEPKKEAPKKETVVTPPAKKAEEKLPTTKEEIKKMQKELTELKIKEKDKVENSENVVGEKIVFLKVKEFLAEGHYSSEMWAVDTENDDELFQSPFKKVCGKEFKELGTGVVVMSYKSNDNLGSDTHHLALLDKDTLKLIKQTNEVVFWRSFLKEQNNKIYAVEFKDGKYYLAQFKDDLTFEMRSNEPINPDCEIAFKKNKIYLTKRAQEGGEVSIRVLNRDNLKLRDLKVMK